MTWMEKSTVSLRQEFVHLAEQESTNMRELCRRFGISPQTRYKWLARFAQQGAGGLIDVTRRPHRSPRTTAAPLQQAVLALRCEHPA